MSTANTLLIKALLLLWVVCVILCEHHKRDVHRIVIKQRIPRSHKKGHSLTHGHDLKRGRHHSGRGNSHSHKKTKTRHSSYEKGSYEDDSYSKENSFEDIIHKPKGYKSSHGDSKKSHSSPLYHVNQDYEETKHIQMPYKDNSKFIFQNEWTPLSSEQLLLGSQETYIERHKKKRDGRKRYLASLKPPPIELTTSYPFQYESSPIFPQLISYPNTFSNYNLNKKIIESNQSPLIGTIEHPIIQFSELTDNYNTLKNHHTSYEVTELIPSDSNTDTFISVPDDNTSDESVEEATTKSNKYIKEQIKSTQRPIRSRGRVTFRGQNKT